ncbi:MAG: hypothetical protein ACRC62_15085 [Microcoleus sp.]
MPTALLTAFGNCHTVNLYALKSQPCGASLLNGRSRFRMVGGGAPYNSQLSTLNSQLLFRICEK